MKIDVFLSVFMVRRAICLRGIGIGMDIEEDSESRMVLVRNISFAQHPGYRYEGKYLELAENRGTTEGCTHMIFPSLHGRGKWHPLYETSPYTL